MELEGRQGNENLTSPVVKSDSIILEGMDEEEKIAEVKNDFVKRQDEGDQSSEGDEKICRICHLGWESSCSDQLIQLGCGCKGELGVSHLPCAQTWFKQKGNRYGYVNYFLYICFFYSNFYTIFYI